MADLTGIYNMALSTASAKGKVGSPTEESREAQVCELWYESVRDSILRAAPWPCARTVAGLAELSARDFAADWVSTDPEPPWGYAYAYPSDMLAPRHMTDYSRFATGLTNGARSILSNASPAVLVYTKRQSTVGAWDSDLLMAIVHGLAAYITVPLTGKLDLAQLNIKLANQKILDARVNAANQDYEPIETLPPWLAARGFGALSDTRYIYPFGETLTLETSSNAV